LEASPLTALVQLFDFVDIPNSIMIAHTMALVLTTRFLNTSESKAVHSTKLVTVVVDIVDAGKSKGKVRKSFEAIKLFQL
jgi:hypothetical protein